MLTSGAAYGMGVSWAAEKQRLSKGCSFSLLARLLWNSCASFESHPYPLMCDSTFPFVCLQECVRVQILLQDILREVSRSSPSPSSLLFFFFFFWVIKIARCWINYMCCNIAGGPPFSWHSSCPLLPPPFTPFLFPLCLFKPLSVISSDNVARRPMPLPRCLSARHRFYQCVFSSSRFWCVGETSAALSCYFFFSNVPRYRLNRHADKVGHPCIASRIPRVVTNLFLV